MLPNDHPKHFPTAFKGKKKEKKTIAITEVITEGMTAAPLGPLPSLAGVRWALNLTAKNCLEI